MKKNYFNVALSATLIVSMLLPNFAMALGNEQDINYTDAMGAGGYDGGGSDYYEEIRKENLAKNAHAYLAESPFPACRDKLLLKESTYQRDKQFWDAMKGDCESRGYTLDVLPDTGFLNTLVSKLGTEEDAKESVEFMQKVGEKALGYVEDNIEHNEKILACARKPDSSSNCKQLLGDLRSVIAEVGPQLRVQMALSDYGKKPVAANRGAVAKGKGYALEEGSFKAINSDMKSVSGVLSANSGLFNYGELAPLSKSEMAEAGKQFAADTAALKEKYKVKALNTKQRGEAFEAHKLQYMTLLARAPILAYYDAAKNEKFIKASGDQEKRGIDPIMSSDEDLAKAVETFLENAKDEQKKIKTALAGSKMTKQCAGGRGPACSDVGDQRRMNLTKSVMKYGNVVQEVLKEDPNSCRTATGIANYIQNTDLRNDVVLIAGMMGGMIVVAAAAPVLAPAFGAAWTANLAIGSMGLMVASPMHYKAAKSYSDASSRAFTALETDTGVSKSLDSFDDYESHRNAFILDMILLPLDVVGIGMASKAMRVSKLLKAKQVPVEKVDEITAALKSKDASKVAKAMAEVKRIVNLTPEEEAFYLAAYKKGILKGTDGANAIRLAGIKNTKDFARNAAVALNEVNQGIVRPDNYRQIYRTIIEGTNFGVADPKTLAAKINQWNESGESLEALANTYKIAAAARLANPALTPDQAIDDALAKQGVDDPAKRKVMCDCAKGGACAIK